MITRVFVSNPEMNKQKNKTKNSLEIFEFSIIPKKKNPGKYMKLSLTNSSEKIKKRRNEKKGPYHYMYVC